MPGAKTLEPQRGAPLPDECRRDDMSASTRQAADTAPRIGSQMRVLMISRKWPPAVGGMENYSREMATELAQLCELDLLVLAGIPGSHQPPSILRLVAFLIRAVWRLVWTGRRFDAIILGDMVLFPLGVWARIVAPHAKIVATAHGTDIAYGLRSGWKPALYRQFLRAIGALRGAVDIVVANSHATAERCRCIGFEHVETIPLAVRSPARVPVEPVENYVLFVGRVDRRKGAGWFATEVLPRLPETIRFKVAGPVWDEQEREAITASGRADFLGSVFGEELARLRRRAIAVVVPNVPVGGRDFEGFGLCATEASGEGGVVIAAALDGIVDAVRDGETGFLLPPEDAEAWTAKIREIAGWDKAKRIEFVERARQATRRFYGWDRVARQTLQAAERISAPGWNAGQTSEYPSLHAFASLQWLKSRVVRTVALIFALAILIGGTWWAVADQPDLFANIRWPPIAIAAILLVPVATGLNALEFMISGRLIGISPPFRSALGVTIVGTAANLFPLPGSSLVRIAGLKLGGAGYGRSTESTLFVALMSIGVAFAYAGLWMSLVGPIAATAIFLAIGVFSLAAALIWSLRFAAGAWNYLLVAAVKVGSIVVEAARVYLCLLALGVPASFAQASCLAVASVVGSAMSVVPAGLGVREGAAAALASVIALPASIGFLSALLNRIVTHVVNALLLTWALAYLRGQRGTPDHARASHAL